MNNKTLQLTLGCLFMSTFIASALFGKNEQPNRQAASPKTAFVNIQRIITFDKNLLDQASIEWKEAYNDLQKTLEPDAKQLEAMQSKYETEKASFAEMEKKVRTEIESLEKGGLVTNEAIQRKTEPLQKKYQEVASLEYELKRRLQEREMFAQEEIGKIQAKIGAKLDKIINQKREEQGWDMILRGDIVLSVSPKFDITQDVLAQLNADYTAEKKSQPEKKSPKA